MGAVYRSRLPRHPFLLFGLPFIAVIVAASFVLTPATALRYERHDRKIRQLNQEEAMRLGLRGEDGEEAIKRNPRRHIIGSDRDEYYVSAPSWSYFANRHWVLSGVSRDLWRRTSTIGSRRESSGSKESQMGGYNESSKLLAWRVIDIALVPMYIISHEDYDIFTRSCIGFLLDRQAEFTSFHPSGCTIDHTSRGLFNSLSLSLSLVPNIRTWVYIFLSTYM